ncbi:fas-binding factor 1 [Topomyia yanbarensis]|uniref:fas-binding factor 1 n=1 Tax=Topomyia yanbarensis TaxID=2498891 RepID=UPI00273C732B|nr:fas-binding factor 1 [Topomyia yanbarensis]
MNFDLDDPLDGLLSDGSNDSLFGNEPAKKTAKAENKQTKMEDLFGIKSNTTNPVPPKQVTPAAATITVDKDSPASLDYAKPAISSGQPPSLGSFQTRKTSTPIKKVEPSQKKEITFDDNDVLSDLGFDPKKPKTKSNILDDLLGGPVITTSKEIIAKQSKTKPSLGIAKDEPVGSKSVSRQSTETSENLPTESTIMGSYAPSGSNQRRSGRRKSSSTLNDPLGLFSSPIGSKKDSKLGKKGADWLGLNDDSNSNDPEPAPNPEVGSEALKQTEVAKPASPKIEQPPKAIVPLMPSTTVSQNVVPAVLPDMFKPDIVTAAQTMDFLNNETQNALNTMQQQEFKLTVANQMKNQEEALFGMQQKQQAILDRQEAQFNELLQKQIMRHNHLEEVISKQQERINTNIQILMTQPPSIPAHHSEQVGLIRRDEQHKHTQDEEEIVLSRVELQSDLKRLQMEKLRLEDLVSNITANHEQEVAILEQSYKKQMGFLDESLKIMEARLKMENKNLEDFYRHKLQGLEEEKQQLIAEHTKQVHEMESSHRSTIEKLKLHYEESLESIKSEHREMINNIRESKMLEFSVLQDNQSYLATLKNAANYLENASGDLQQLRDTLQDQLEFTQKEKEIQLKEREKRLDDQQRLLERTKESAETEKMRLLNLVEMLEGKLTDLSKISSEETWNYQQKLVKLEAEKQAFEKEKEHARERILRQEKQIEELKQLQLEEHSKLMQNIRDEKQLLLEEKAKLETLDKIQKQDRTDLSRAEIDAAIKVAEDAAHQCDQERERLLQLQRQYETKRREMIGQESQLRAKSSELENAISNARTRVMAAESAFKSIKRAEQNMQLKMQLVQRQFREVSEREDRLAKDKIELSKERLELQSMRKRLQTNRCNLCKIGERSQEIGDYLTAAHNSESVDDDRKLEASFLELQHRELGKLDQFFDGDLERQLHNFFERNRIDPEQGTSNLVPNIAENEGGTADDDLLLLRFDVLKSQNYFDAENDK